MNSSSTDRIGAGAYTRTALGELSFLYQATTGHHSQKPARSLTSHFFTGNLYYALIVLKLFTAEFARSKSCGASLPGGSRTIADHSSWPLVGLIYVILSCLLLLIAQLRRKRSDHDFSGAGAPHFRPPLAVILLADTRRASRPADKYTTEDPLALPGVKASERLWGTRPFRTSGDIIMLLTVVCAALFIALFVLIMKL